MWTKTFGGSQIDDANSVRQTTDGGYIIAGATKLDVQNTDVYLIKTDPNGDTLWTRRFGGDRGDGGSAVLQTTDGGYIITGGTYASTANFIDVYLIKTDANGDTLWTKTCEDSGLDVQRTAEGGYIISGYSNSFGSGGVNVYLIKTDSNGNASWTRTLGGNYDLGYSVRQTTDGGYIIAGSTYVGSFNYAFLLKTDANGNMLWRKTFGAAQYDFARSVWQTADGGYIVTGYGSSFGDGSYDAFLIKTDANGNLWSR